MKTLLATLSALLLTLSGTLGVQKLGSFQPISVPAGGTGSTTLTGILKGNGTSSVQSVVIGSNLTLTGTTLSATGGSPGGASSTVQFNNNGTFQGDNNLTWNPSTKTLIIGTTSPFTAGIVSVGTVTAAGDGKALTLKASDATASNHNGGQISATAGRGIGFGTGGTILFQGGLGGTTGAGGAGGLLQFQAGDAGAGNKNGGDVIFLAGLKSGGGTDGHIMFQDQNGFINTIFDTSLVTADQTFTFPDFTGTFCLVSVNCAATTTNNTWSGLQTFTNIGTSTFTGGVAANIFNATSLTASSTFANGIDLTNGCFSIGGTCISGGGGGSVTSVTATYPVLSSLGNTPNISLAFGTTTANTWSLNQIFTTGVQTDTLKANSSSGVSVKNSNGIEAALIGAGPSSDMNVNGTFNTGLNSASYLSISGGAVGSPLLFSLLGSDTNSSYSFLTKGNGVFGIGTTTASTTLSVQGSALISGNLSIANLTATGTLTVGGTGTSTFVGGISTNGTIDSKSSTATSTFSNGIQLSKGCFQDSTGTCVGSATPSPSTWSVGATSTKEGFLGNMVVTHSLGRTPIFIEIVTKSLCHTSVNANLDSCESDGIATSTASQYATSLSYGCPAGGDCAGGGGNFGTASTTPNQMIILQDAENPPVVDVIAKLTAMDATTFTLNFAENNLQQDVGVKAIRVMSWKVY